MPDEVPALDENASHPDNLQVAESRRGFYALLEDIRQRPQLYLGRKSVRDLFSWLQGYHCAKSMSSVAQSEEELEFATFDFFVCQKYRWHDVGGWAAKIAYYHRDDFSGLDEFFKLFDEFREIKRKQRARPKRRRGQGADKEKQAEPGAAADSPREHGASSHKVKPA